MGSLLSKIGLGSAVIGVAVVCALPQAFAAAPICSYTVVNSFPHDPDAYTQGLLFSNGVLFESTGLYGQSSLRRVALETGTVLQQTDLSSQYFGEGLALWQDNLIQLTWRENIAFIWDVDTFAPSGSFGYTGEGWGLTHDDHRLIMSDGTSALRFLDPVTHAEQGSVDVRDDGIPVEDINELEWIRGEVFANVLGIDSIARINPDTGDVIAWVDLAGLRSSYPLGSGVLNGIAWEDGTERLFVTGKLWPWLFEIEMVGCPELRPFSDDFESGSLARWSRVTP